MNVKLLRKIQRHIKKRGVFDMHRCSDTSHYGCGCIAHWAFWIGKRQLGAAYMGQADLEIKSAHDCSRLIFIDEWPKKFQAMYRKNRSKAGIARISHFIKTKGKE